ncbi:MFS transporter [Stackebrandtia nassauensis]|uniref:Major facilitator superfamily MFS_1 n=1 Tax=Stackebrandtia nassauensis (strain DSM 44728 / CIP 108903 / NRRL B-16338 / NBRC 102104 / LLR-40K-21) TaxID=446470 RepID=D3PV95_STANL|nr:MFS transporter [Stackebrandtia nassauensis]ADD41148.1 major facilitator superfamily MFS_1 [Stackebrandtia nassauensis DSM 44728]
MHTLDATALRRRYFLITLLTWLPLGMGAAGLVLLVTERGFDLATVGVLFLVQGLVVSGLELPTGGLADVIGRRGVLIASAVVGLVAMLWTAVATGWWELVLVAVLRGVSRALSSGPAEAWYVDSVHALSPDADIRRGLGLGNTATSIGLAVGTLAGGFIPLAVPLPDDGLVIPLSIPMFIGAALFALLLLVVGFGMPEPARTGARPRLGEVLRGVPATVTGGIRLGLRDRGLLRLLSLAVFAGMALNAVELLTPGRMETLAGSAEAGASVYGVVAMIGFAASGLGSSLSHTLTRLVGGRVRLAAVIGVLVSVLGLVVLFGTGAWSGTVGIVGACAGYAVMYVGIGLRMPVTSELIHRRVASGERATVVSIQSLLLQGGGSLATLGLPVLAAVWSVPGAWLVSGALLAVSALLYRRTRADRAAEDPARLSPAGMTTGA